MNIFGKWPPSGLLGGVSHTFRALVAHMRALFQLVQVEGKQALASTVQIVAFLVVGLVALIFAYSLFLICVTAALWALLGIKWLWLVLLILAIIHIAAAAICYTKIKKVVQQPLFPHTLREIGKDLDSISNTDLP